MRGYGINEIVNMMKLKNILENNLYKLPLSEIQTDGKCIINTINPHSYCEAKKDKHFEQALLSSDVLLPDGTGIVIASKMLLGENVKKIAGDDIHSYLLKKADQLGQKIFYLGSTTNTLTLIENRIRLEFPNITVASYSPPYKSHFSVEDSDKMINAINKVQPDILFVGMTAPKQEKWVFDYKEKINTHLIVSIGAVFDFYSGNIERSDRVWIKLGLEWLPRFVKEPKRLWRRNMVSTPKFLFEVFKEKLS